MNRVKVALPARPARVNGAPPNDIGAEDAALGCILCASDSPSEQDAILAQLRPTLFWSEQHKAVLDVMAKLRGAGHAVDLVTLTSALRSRDLDVAVGGVVALSRMMDACPTYLSFPTHLSALKLCALRRWTLAKQAKLGELAHAPGITLDDIRAEFSDLQEGADKIGTASAPMIELVRPSEARAYVADPRTFLLGDGIIARGELSVIAGWPGLGKSRLSTTLAVAGALGMSWMGYPIRRRFRTLIVQSENSLSRLRVEFLAVPDDAEDWIRVSKPTALRVSDANFRREMRRFLADWRPDLVILDPWSDITRDENFGDHQEALDHIRDMVGLGDDAPACLIVAHLRKQRGGDSWRPRAGRELLHELAGSFALAAKARTVFVLQPASMEQDDDRVVFDCGKANNDKPEVASCWRRCNGAFERIDGFDFDAWMNPPDDAGRRRGAITADVLRAKLAGRAVLRRILVDELVEAGFGSSTAYRKTDPKGEFTGNLVEDVNGLLSWRD